MINVNSEARFYLERFLIGIDPETVNWKPEKNINIFLGRNEPRNKALAVTAFGEKQPIALLQYHIENAKIQRRPEFRLIKIANQYYIQHYNNDCIGEHYEFFRFDLNGNVMQMPEMQDKQKECNEMLLKWLQVVYNNKVDKDIACQHCGEFGLLHEKNQNQLICVHCKRTV